MDSSVIRSPIWRYVIGGTSLLSLILFAGIWVANLVTTGFSLAGTQTFAGWTYFPLFWPHLAAATLGAMVFLRYGSNYATALAVVVLWLVAVVCDVFVAVVYWRLFWLCNIGGKGQLTGVALQICNSENALLISMMVFATVMMVIAFVAAVGHGLDFRNAGKAGSAVPGRGLSAELILVGAACILSFLALMSLWIINFITSADSIGGGHTYAVWAYIDILLVQISASVVGIMMFLRYGANFVTAAAAVILWAVAFFAAFYCGAVYWRVGWMCFVSTGSTLTGNELVMCNAEGNYLIAVWVLVTILFLCSVVAPLAHAADYFSAARSGSVKINFDAGGSVEEPYEDEGGDMGLGEEDNPSEAAGNKFSKVPPVFTAARSGAKALRAAGSSVLPKGRGLGRGAARFYHPV